MYVMYFVNNTLKISFFGNSPNTSHLHPQYISNIMTISPNIISQIDIYKSSCFQLRITVLINETYALKNTTYLMFNTHNQVLCVTNFDIGAGESEKF